MMREVNRLSPKPLAATHQKNKRKTVLHGSEFCFVAIFFFPFVSLV